MANDEEPEEKQQPVKKPKSRTIIIAFVGLAFVVIVLVFVKSLVFPTRGGGPLGGAGVEPGDSPSVTQPGEVLQMWEILVNLAKPDQDTFISVKVAVEIDSEPRKDAEELRKELAGRKIEFKQVIEEILQSRTRDDLSSETGREGTRQEMLRKINARLQSGHIRKVLTTDMLFS